jgi:hypothetical protein
VAKPPEIKPKENLQFVSQAKLTDNELPQIHRKDSTGNRAKDEGREQALP